TAKVMRADGATPQTIQAERFSTFSSLRYKNICGKVTDTEALKLLELELIKYTYKIAKDKQIYAGVTAEQTDALGIKTVVQYDGEGRADSVDYAGFVPYIVKLLQMQNVEIAELKTINTKLLKRLEILEGKVK
ncbi:MAG: hypothetical protein RR292_07930, partial [Christensenellaceae bacterium]